MRKFEQLRRFVVALSGADAQVLDIVPSERARFESLGWAVLITSCMAAISMWFALSSALGINGILAVPVALFWGLVIMGIDRWLITSMPIDGGRRFAIAIPRLLLAVLLGTLISTPLVLRVFQSEINAQMAVMQQQDYNSFLLQQQGSQVSKQVSAYRDELQQLNTVINSRGAQTGNSAADPQLVAYRQQLTGLDAQLAHWTSLKATYYTDYTCQLYGGAQCPKKGNGPAAKASYQSYQQASAQVTSYQAQIGQVQGEIQQRDQVLNSTSKSSQLQRYDEAVSQRPVVQNEYNTAVQRQNQLQASYYAQEQAAHGILMRLEALSQLSNGNTTVSGARILLFLLFLVIECLPVTVKLLQRPGQYEAALLEAKKAEERDFKKAFAGHSRLRPAMPGPQAGLRSFAPQAGLRSFAEQRPFAGQPGAEPEQEPAAGPIWNRTRVLPVPADGTGQAGGPAGDYEDARPTEVFRDLGPVGSRAGHGMPGDPPRKRRWRGTDDYRNLWSGRDQAPEPRQEPQPDPLPDPHRPDSMDTDGYQLPPDFGRPTSQTVIDSPAATMTDSPAAAVIDRPAVTVIDRPAGPTRLDLRPTPPPETASPASPASPASAAGPDGNGSGLPLNWDDE